MRAILLSSALLLIANGAAAQAVTVKEDAPGLLAQATLTPDSALKIALHRVPGSTMKEGEIEKEHGKLVYSFDLAVAGKSGIDEVQVDAKTGKVVSVEHESAAEEAREAKEEKDKVPAKP